MTIFTRRPQFSNPIPTPLQYVLLFCPPEEVVVNDAKWHDIAILPVDVMLSRARCTVESDAIRLGFNYVSGIGEVRGEEIEVARDAGPFRHLGDFCRGTQLPRRTVENLIRVGAMDAWDIPRRQLL